ncbi:MAG: S9 family peptidase [Flavobacteriales bacterium]|nr:S9 family peptidase [Flavobacteriales bacterium]
MRLLPSIAVLLLIHPCAFAQTSLTLEDIWQHGTYRTEGVQGLRSMNDGLHYTVMSSAANGKSIVKYAYRTGEEVAVFIPPAMLTYAGRALAMEEYAFNADETQVLVATEPQELYRYSSSYAYYTLNIATGKVQPVAGGAQVFHATFSPASDRVAYVRDNDLWVENLTTGATVRLTDNGRKDFIINGMSDWVYEEEFAFTQAFQWSPDGKHIAYYEFNEEQVREFTMMNFSGMLYPEKVTFKYPKAGEANSIVNIFIADSETGHRVKVDIGTETDIYIPRIKWTRNAGMLSVQRLNRLQNRWDLLLASAKDGSTRTILSEESKTYIDINDNLIFLENANQFIYSSERDGFHHLYLHDMSGKLVMQLTKGNWEVTEFYGLDTKEQNIYYQSLEEGPSQRHVYSVSIDGRWKRKLTPERGHNDADFSTGMHYFINRHSTADTPPVITLNDAKGKQIRVLKDNQRLRELAAKVGMVKREFFTFIPSHGTALNAWAMKPANMDPAKKYPVLLYVYGGSGRTYVEDDWNVPNILWLQYMVQQGYVVVAMDPRGTDHRGRDFKHSIYMELGKLETEDCIETAKYLATLPYVDKDRIGMFGWSYGGYLSSLGITKGADHFKAAIAVAPVTNWRYYDNIYTERFMRTPQENPSGYDDNSPVNHVNKLRGSYLLIHGSGDDNVHFQHSMVMIEALIKANKQFDLMVYPDLDHGIYGPNSRLHLFTKMTDFLKKNL